MPTEAVTIPLARHLVSSALENAGVTQGCLDEVKVALTEACTNAYQHAGHGETYDVVITLDGASLVVDVHDKGRGIDGVGAHQGSRSAGPYDGSTSADPHAETGRGVSLIRALTDGATFDSVSADGGSVHMWKRLELTAGAPWATATSTDHPPRPVTN